MTIYYAMGAYHTVDKYFYDVIPYDLFGTWEVFTDKKDFWKFLKKCNLTEVGCKLKCYILNRKLERKSK